MKVQPPTFVLKRPCPVCEQGHSLALMSCTSCARLVVVCEEEGSVFPDPQALSKETAGAGKQWSGEETECPDCGKLGTLSLATGDQIQAAGIPASDYE